MKMKILIRPYPDRLVHNHNGISYIYIYKNYKNSYASNNENDNNDN